MESDELVTRITRLEERDKAQNERLGKIERSLGRIEIHVTDMRTDMRAAKKAGGWLLSAAMAIGAIFGAAVALINTKQGG